MIKVEYAGSRYESQKEAPEGLTETLELWLRAAHLDGAFSYRAVDRTKGTATMARVHAISVRDGKFVNARIRPEGRGNANSWIVSIPIPSGMEADRFLSDLQIAERMVNGDEDQILESKLAMLYTYLDGKPIDASTLDSRMATRSKFETVEYMEHDLDTLAARKLFVRKTSSRTYEWRKKFAQVPVPPLQEEWSPTPAEVFVLSLTADERALIRELVHLNARMEDAHGNLELRLPNELPLFEEEIVQFMDKAEQFGLVKQVGDNPHGILSKVWKLEFPLLLVCILQIGYLYPQDKRDQAQLEAAPPAEFASNLETGLVAAAADRGSANTQPVSETAPPPQPPPERPTPSFEIVRTIALRGPTKSEEEVIKLQEEYGETQRLLAEADAKRNDTASELETAKQQLEALQSKIAERQRVAAEAEELSVRLESQLNSLGERMQAAETRSADEAVERILALLQQEIENSEVPRDALIEAMKKRLPPGFSFPGS